MSSFINEISPELSLLISKTANGEIRWRSINPTTFYWTKVVDKDKIRTTIQMVNGPNDIYYRFEVKDILSDEEIISIDTRELDGSSLIEIKNLIEELYNTVENNNFREMGRRSEIFRKLLD